MHSHRLISIGLALALATSGLAFGQNRDGRDDRPRSERNNNNNNRNDHNRNDRGPRGSESERRDLRPEDRRYENGRYPSPVPQARYDRGAGPNHDFRPGYRLPPYYRSRQFAVDDWRVHRLSAPPRGYYWVQSGGDYLLVAIATGIIVQLLLGN
jgi:Ni/Co efflux regulator RcnB